MAAMKAEFEAMFEAKWEAMLKHFENLKDQESGARGGRVHAQVASGVDYVHLAGPTPAEAAAAGRQRQRQAAKNDARTKKTATRTAGAGA